MAVFFTFDRNYRPLTRSLDQSRFLATLFQKFFKIYFNASDICWIDRVPMQAIRCENRLTRQKCASLGTAEVVFMSKAVISFFSAAI